MTGPGSRTMGTPSRPNPPGGGIGRPTPVRPVDLCGLVAVVFSLGSAILYWIGLARVEMNPLLYQATLDWWFVLMIAFPATVVARMRGVLTETGVVTVLGVLVALQFGLLGYLLMRIVRGVLWRAR